MKVGDIVRFKDKRVENHLHFVIGRYLSSPNFVFLSSGIYSDISNLEVIEEADKVSVYKQFFESIVGKDYGHALDYEFNNDIFPDDISDVQDIEI